MTAPGLLDHTGAFLAGSMRRDGVPWIAVGVGLLTTPVWTPPAVWAVCVAAVLVAEFRIAWMPAALRRGPAATAVWLLGGAALAWPLLDRVAVLPWAIIDGLGLSGALLVAEAVAAARRAATPSDPDAAFAGIVTWGRRRPWTTAFAAFCGVDPAGTLLTHAVATADLALSERAAYSGAGPLAGVSDVVIGSSHLLAVATWVVPPGARRALQSLHLAWFAAEALHLGFVRIGHAIEPTPWTDVVIVWRMEYVLVGSGLFAGVLLLRGARAHVGWGFALPVLAAIWFPLGITINVRLGWDRLVEDWAWSPRESAAVVVLSIALFAFVAAAFLAPVPGRRLFVSAVAYGAALSVAGGLLWDAQDLAFAAAPAAAAGWGSIAALVLFAREVRRHDGTGRAESDRPDGGDEPAGS